MGSTSRGFRYPPLTGTGGDADVPRDLQNLAEDVQAEFDSNLTLGGYLEVITKLSALGTTFAFLDLYASSATTARRRANLSTSAGHTKLTAVSDDGSTTLFTGLDMNHATGAVDFPNGVTATDLTVNGAPIAGASNRGAVSIATAQSTTSTSYTLLTTPDRVQNIVLPTNGLIVVAYQAIWQNTVASNARAGIFLNSTQIKLASGSGSPATGDAVGPVETNDDGVLSTSPSGTVSGLITGGGAGATTEVATGQMLGSTAGSNGPVYIFAAAGTYDISVQFKNNAAGTLTVKNRHLWVWVLGF